MVTVKMPRAQWESVLYILEEHVNMDWPRINVVTYNLMKEIKDQVYSQEY
jgi:hypothetical protein